MMICLAPPSIKALATTKDFLEASVLQLPDRDASLRDFAVPWSGGMMQLVAMKKGPLVSMLVSGSSKRW